MALQEAPAQAAYHRYAREHGTTTIVPILIGNPQWDYHTLDDKPLDNDAESTGCHLQRINKDSGDIYANILLGQ